jgi:signal transduction histidine kinase
MGITLGMVAIFVISTLVITRMVIYLQMQQIGLDDQVSATILATLIRSFFWIAAVMFILGIIGSLVLSDVVTRPVRQLIEATHAVEKGDLSHNIDMWFQDEIGDLTVAFNAMASALAQAQAKTESQYQSLAQQNRELSMVNAINQAVNVVSGPQEILSTVLERILESVGSCAGWICLNERNGWKPFQVYYGLKPDSAVHPGTQCESNCYQSHIHHGQIQCTPNELFPCPFEDQCASENTRVWGYVSLPIQSKSLVVGRLNAARSVGDPFTEQELHLLQTAALSLGLAIENINLWEEIRQKEIHRTLLFKKLVTIQEDEHRWIARELHDEMGQSMTSLLIGLKVLEKWATQPAALELISKQKETVVQMIETIRNLAVELRPSVLDDLGLVPALEKIAREYHSQMGLNVDFAAPGLSGSRLPVEIETTLYRIIQESLTNVARHAHTEHASVLLELRDGAVITIIDDDGCGFDVNGKLHSSPRKDMLGLIGIEERAQLLGGKTTIESSPGLGTTIFVEIPLTLENAG